MTVCDRLAMNKCRETDACNSVEFTELDRQFGPLISGQDLVRNLGYNSAAAFRQAHKRGTLPIDVFEIPNRRGKFALTSDIIRWLTTVKRLSVKKEGG